MDILLNSVFIQVAIVFITGLAFSKVAKLVHLPAVTGYLIGGLLLGPYVFNVVNADTVEMLSIFSDIALGFIAFSIGSSFKLSYFKRVGAAPIIIACLESFFAVVFVFVLLLIFGQELEFSLMLAAIAAATAPAATIMVIKQYKAKGPVTDTLMSVVAIDDATALILFGFALAIVNSLNQSGESTSLILMLLSPLWDILKSIILGAAIGIVLSYVVKFFKDNGARNPLIIATVLLSLGVANFIGASNLMVCMIVGAVFCNLSKQADGVMNLVDTMTPALFMMFFVMSGAELNVSILPQIGLVGIIYVIARVAGKYFGAFLGAKISKCQKTVKDYLGFCLIPQAGVAIGLSLVAEASVPGHGATIRAVILCGTLIYELIGPFATKTALIKAKEITE